MGTLQSKKCHAACECLPFRLQPYCTLNRHMHAYIENNSDICIDDLTCKRRLLIKGVIDSSQQLLEEDSVPPGLTSCNLIANHWDHGVVQVFYKKSVEFYVCNLTSQTCTYKYVMCSCTERRPGLCEAYFTTNKQFLILKANDTYITLFSNGSELDHNFIEVVKLDDMTLASNHYVLSASDTRAIPFGLCPDPDTPTGIYAAFTYFFYYCSRGNGIYSDKSVVDVSVPFQRTSDRQIDGEPNRLHIEYDMAPHVHDTRTWMNNSRLINIQIPENSSFVLLSTATKRLVKKKKRKPNAASKYEIEVHLHKKTRERMSYETWNYLSSTKTQLEWPKLSPTGTYGFVDGQRCLFSDRRVLKCLSALCVDLLRELVVPESVQFLPLPGTLKDMLRYSDTKMPLKHKFDVTSV